MKCLRFLRCCLLILAVVTAKGANPGIMEQSGSKELTFGIIADIHPDIVHDGEQRLQAFLEAAAENKVDFIIELGDFCFAKSSNIPFRDLWNKFPGDKYHVLGNHDMDICTKEQYMKFVGMKHRYYSFDKGDFHFIVLDPNNLFVDGEYIPYKNGNFYVDDSQRDHLDPEQIEWLKKDLAATDKQCILFSHECFENTVQNRELVRSILEAENRRCGFKKVVAAFSGHDHTNYTKEINGITYIQINSASNQWVGEKYACPQRFSNEINKQRPSLKYTVPYKDCLYAIVTIDSNTLKMKGRESSFIAPTPADMEIPDTLYPFPLVPWIKDFSLPLDKCQKPILPVPSAEPSAAQLKQIARKYGMFIHFGINTFHDQEWTDGSKPASSYRPTTIDAEQWIKVAKDAGMKYVILTAKHHEGFCLWDSKYTDYDVAGSGNKTNVVEAVAKACKKYGIGLGLYYSLWDRKANADVKDRSQDAEYNTYLLCQLNELIDIVQPHTSIVEFWFDGGWEKENDRWPVKEIYQTIKSREPDCQIGINWTIGLPDHPDAHLVLPADQKEGYPIRYFPSDFRLGDPYLPADDDPKRFSHEGQRYYMPWESTVCISERWFYNTTDRKYKSVEELAALYRQCTKNDNILILNCPPARDGRIREKDIEVLMKLRKMIQ